MSTNQVIQVIPHRYPIDPLEVPVGVYEFRLRFLGKGNVYIGTVYRDDHNNPMFCLANEKSPRGSIVDWMSIESLTLIRRSEPDEEIDGCVVV